MDSYALHKYMPIIIDPTLVKAAQLTDLEIVTDAKEQDKPIRYLVQIYFGLEESFNETLCTRIQAAKGGNFMYPMMLCPYFHTIPLGWIVRFHGEKQILVCSISSFSILQG